MKKVLTWVKANLLIVVFSTIIIISIPAAFFGASMWGGTIKRERGERATKLLSDVRGTKYSYSLPPTTPGGAAVEEKIPPNSEISKNYAAQRAAAEKASLTVVQSALDFNQGKGAEAAKIGRKPHEPLVADLFPKPASENSQTELTNRFVNMLVDTPQKPSVYTAMLREVLNAGGPVDPIELGKRLEGEKATQMARLVGSGADANRKLTEAEQTELDRGLLEIRRRAHLARASEISVYATLESLPIEGSSGAEGSTIPRAIPERPPAVSRAFQWQMDYWLLRDLMTAVRVANQGSAGRPVGVSEGVVKRIERITILEPFAVGTGPTDSAPVTDPTAAAAPAAATTMEQLTGLVPTDPLLSVTGRKGGPQNPLYDVRPVKMVMVVSAPRLKELFNAFAKTNFMTITDVDLKEVDVRGDLDRGYYYGPESVVQATIMVETIWLRGWTQPLFPSGVKKRLGLPLAEGEKSDDAEMGSSAGGGPSGGSNPFGGNGGSGVESIRRGGR